MGSSTIDVAAVSKTLRGRVISNVLQNALANSDHSPLKIRWSLSTQPLFFPRPPPRVSKWNYAKASWEEYRTKLDTYLQHICWEGTVDNINTSIVRAIKDAAKTTILRYRRPTYKPYWNRTLESLRLRKNRIRRVIHARVRAGLPWDILRRHLWETQREYSRELRSAQRQQWDTFTSSISLVKRREWKAVRTLAFGSTVQQAIYVDGVTGKQAAQRYSLYMAQDIYRSRFSNRKCRKWSRQAWSLHRKQRETYSRARMEWATLTEQDRYALPYQEQAQVVQGSAFTRSEFRRALHHLNKSTAPGPDEISAQLVAEGSELLHNSFLRLLNITLTTSQIPRAWRTSRIIVIKKTRGEATQATASDYRPISITNVMARLAESMVVYRMECQLEREAPSPISPGLDEHQHGFRPARSVEEQVAYIHSSVQQEIESNRITAFISLDWTKAYDTIDGAKSKSRKQHHGLPQGRSRRRSIHPSTVTIDNTTVDPQESLRILGVYFDSTLTWKPYVDRLDVLEPAQDHIRLYASLAHYAASKHNHLFTSPSQPLYHYPPVPPGLATAPWRGCLTLKETLPKNPLPIDYRQAITATLDDYAAHQYTMLLIDGSYHQDEIHHFGNRAGYAWSFSTSTTSLHPPQHTFTVVSTGEGSLGPHIYSSFDAELWGIYYALRQLLDDPDQATTKQFFKHLRLDGYNPRQNARLSGRCSRQGYPMARSRDRNLVTVVAQSRASRQTITHFLDGKHNRNQPHEFDELGGPEIRHESAKAWDERLQGGEALTALTLTQGGVITIDAQVNLITTRAGYEGREITFTDSVTSASRQENTIYNEFYGSTPSERNDLIHRTRCTPPAGKSTFDPLYDEPRMAARESYVAYLSQKVLNDRKLPHGGIRSNIDGSKREASPPVSLSAQQFDQAVPRRTTQSLKEARHCRKIKVLYGESSAESDQNKTRALKQ
ncbi:conserved hypothetical protein [Perkinsus marinus ATCC 50983]|uniref:Reverse transcriptase domain-containing protein n=1 Tax=Perkinsus marinus (strain ATCC 50983 / TXsc) TaxID=423536 RepID=C5KE24_PERM5|nr:conserved hypothetical protein [Perkinsus marinus ATCC 50983]EER17236.1 conserved hypothetical protein [Perkinsus marinus ATCC 50983]|eukprot:XP_002785440.1 conserved hypothetical protein [Perkinsus marinus ATCC 50983]